MELNEKAILEEAQRLAKEGKYASDELFKLLGGEELYVFFDEMAVNALMKNLVEKNKIHTLHEGDTTGIDIISGLLNKNITGNMEAFYSINPEYVFMLDEEQQANLAKSFTDGNKDLEELLKKVWSRGIKTHACGGQSECAYLYVGIPENQISDIIKFKNVSERTNYNIGIGRSREGKYLNMSIYGEKDVLYKELLDELKKEEIDCSQNFISKIISAYSEQEFTYTEDDKNAKYTEKQWKEREKEFELILEEDIQNYMNIINQLEQENEELNKKCSNVEDKYSDLKTRFLEVRTFIKERIGRIPFLGRKVLKELKDQLEDNKLPKGNDESSLEK